MMSNILRYHLNLMMNPFVVQHSFTQPFFLSPFSDSAFTERIMGLPVENYKGYVEADATQKAKNIDSDTFFLIHGLADATTPYHHGVQLARSLTEAGTIFRYTVRNIFNGCTLHF